MYINQKNTTAGMESKTSQYNTISMYGIGVGVKWTKIDSDDEKPQLKHQRPTTALAHLGKKDGIQYFF